MQKPKPLYVCPMILSYNFIAFNRKANRIKKFASRTSKKIE